MWERELAGDPDRDYIVNGLKHGFYIVDDVTEIDQRDVHVKNGSSVLHPNTRRLVEDQVLLELNHGRYVVTETKPSIVSALSAVPKSDGGIRLIHDFSRPDELSVNSYATKESFCAETVDDAVSRIGPGWYMAKVDLQSAYRTVPVHPSQFTLTGLQWTFQDKSTKFMYDSRLPFGARKSPQIFHTLTQAVKRMMVRRGFVTTTVLLDDFFIAGETFDECLLALNTLHDNIKYMTY